MDATKYLMVAAAAVIVLWPQLVELVKLVKKVKIPSMPVASGSVGYQESLVALAAVRRRLVDTDTYEKDVNAAIELITHALVEGSDL